MRDNLAAILADVGISGPDDTAAFEETSNPAIPREEVHEASEEVPSVTEDIREDMTEIHSSVSEDDDARPLNDSDIDELFDTMGMGNMSSEHNDDVPQDTGETHASGDITDSYEPYYEPYGEDGNAEETEHNDNAQSEDLPLIPGNSPTLLVDDSTSRFSGTLWYEKVRTMKIILAGAGGIGSNAAFQLARLHPEKMVIIDPDRVEEVNMAGQLYSKMDIGSYKSDAVSRMIMDYTNTGNIFSVSREFNAATDPGPVMICGFDNMDARKVFYNKWKDYVLNSAASRKECLFIDGRLSIDMLQVLCIAGDDEYSMQRYEKEFLFSSEDVEHTVCSMKQTTYLACMIGSVITNLFVNFSANLCDPVIPYDLPFFTCFDAPTMMFKTEE